VKRLGVFIGEWSLEASFSDPPLGRVVFEWALSQQFMIERTENDHPAAPDSIAIVAFSPHNEAYTQHYFDSRGVVRVYAMAFGQGVWTLLRGSPDFTPLDFWQRFKGTFSEDGNTIKGAWENFQDGAHWERDFDLTYTKVKPKGQ
jgi:hypothetical protein